LIKAKHWKETRQRPPYAYWTVAIAGSSSMFQWKLRWRPSKFGTRTFNSGRGTTWRSSMEHRSELRKWRRRCGVGLRGGEVKRPVTEEKQPARVWRWHTSTSDRLSGQSYPRSHRGAEYGQRESTTTVVVVPSVTFARPTQAVQIFSNISTALAIYNGHSLMFTENFTDRPSWNPFTGGVKHKWGSQI